MFLMLVEYLVIIKKVLGKNHMKNQMILLMIIIMIIIMMVLLTEMETTQYHHWCWIGGAK